MGYHANSKQLTFQWLVSIKIPELVCHFVAATIHSQIAHAKLSRLSGLNRICTCQSPGGYRAAGRYCTIDI